MIKISYENKNYSDAIWNKQQNETLIKNIKNQCPVTNNLHVNADEYNFMTSAVCKTAILQMRSKTWRSMLNFERTSVFGTIIELTCNVIPMTKMPKSDKNECNANRWQK